MKTTIEKQGLDNIELKAGERAKCVAGYPKQGTVIIEAIKDFDNAGDDIIDNPRNYFRVVNEGRYGLLTSHMISNYWEKITA